MPIYDTPKPYLMNVQPVNSDSEIAEFGAKATGMQKALIEMKPYYGMFKEFDLAYLDGANPTGETVNGENANYRLHPPRNQNKCIRIYLERIVAKDDEQEEC